MGTLCALPRPPHWLHASHRPAIICCAHVPSNAAPSIFQRCRACIPAYYRSNKPSNLPRPPSVHPCTGKSIYDSLEMSVVFYVPYHNGIVVCVQQPWHAVALLFLRFDAGTSRPTSTRGWKTLQGASRFWRCVCVLLVQPACNMSYSWVTVLHAAVRM